MSQEKVDKYKYEKAHRKEIMKKQKMMQIARNTAMGVIAIVLIGWLGYSAYDTYTDSQPREEVVVDYSTINGYLQTLELAEQMAVE